MSGRYIRLLALLLSATIQTNVQAQCWYNNSDGNKAEYFLVNGLVNLLDPEIIFDIPGNGVGNGAYISTTTINNPGSNSRPDEVRFRLNTEDLGNSPNRSITLFADSTLPLTCTNCSSSVNIPVSKIGWQTSTTRGDAPSDGQFNDSTLTWISSSVVGQDNLFFLSFDFLNDTVYPAGTYTGEFLTRGEP